MIAFLKNFDTSLIHKLVFILNGVSEFELYLSKDILRDSIGGVYITHLPNEVEHHGLDAGLAQVLRAALCVVVKQILHYGDGLFHKLGVGIIYRYLGN